MTRHDATEFDDYEAELAYVASEIERLSKPAEPILKVFKDPSKRPSVLAFKYAQTRKEALTRLKTRLDQQKAFKRDLITFSLIPVLMALIVFLTRR